MSKSKILFLIILMFPLFLSAQEKGYKIDVCVNGLPNTSVLLAFYFDDGTYIKGNGKTDAKGNVHFSGDEKLNRGVYFLVHDSLKQKMFEFVVADDQHFSIKTDKADYYKNFKVDGSTENDVFYQNLQFNAQQNLKAAPYTAIFQDSTASKEDRLQAEKELMKINDEVKSFQSALVKKYPTAFITKIIKARETIPSSSDPAHVGDSTYQYYFFKNQYWTKIDLADDGMLRLPFTLITNKINEYFDRVLIQDPDTIISEINKLVEKAKPNQEMYKFVVWSLTSKYYAPQVMGLDQVFVHLSDAYFESGEMDFWANDQMKLNITSRAGQLRLSMLGMQAPNLIMQDVKLQPKSMADIKNKFTIVYFYDPDCGHCKKETPVLADFVNKTKFDVQVYSVCADTSLVKMEKYITEMHMEQWINVNGPRSYVGSYQDLYDAFQTPTLYVLNEKKKIIAKKLPADRLEEFLTRYSSAQK